LFIKTSADFADAADFQINGSREGREGNEGKPFLRELRGLRAKFVFCVNRRNLRIEVGAGGGGAGFGLLNEETGKPGGRIHSWFHGFLINPLAAADEIYFTSVRQNLSRRFSPFSMFARLVA
jgi:hypothetical protein